MIKDIFDLKNLSDIPLELKENLQVSRGRFSEAGRQILSLFDLKNELSLDEILVGMFRKYNVVTTRNCISSNVYNYRRMNLIKMVDKGVYKKI